MNASASRFYPELRASAVLKGYGNVWYLSKEDVGTDEVGGGRYVFVIEEISVLSSQSVCVSAKKVV